MPHRTPTTAADTQGLTRIEIALVIALLVLFATAVTVGIRVGLAAEAELQHKQQTTAPKASANLATALETEQ